MLLGGTWSQWGETGRKRKLNFSNVCLFLDFSCVFNINIHMCDHVSLVFFAFTHDDSLAFLHFCDWSLSLTGSLACTCPKTRCKNLGHLSTSQFRKEIKLERKDKNNNFLFGVSTLCVYLELQHIIKIFISLLVLHSLCRYSNMNQILFRTGHNKQHRQKSSESEIIFPVDTGLSKEKTAWFYGLGPYLQTWSLWIPRANSPTA